MKCIGCHQGEAYVAEDVTASVSDFVREARGMARREVLVQLDDNLVRRLDELAVADLELVAAYQRQPADPALVQSARRLAAKTAPAW